MAKRWIVPTPATALALLALFFALGGSSVAVTQSLTQQKEGQVDSFVGISKKSEADAVHRAALLAARFEGGKYKGDTFEVTRIQITIANPHITAYKATITPSG